MTRYLAVVRNNYVSDITPLPDEDEEYLGIEWALSEIKDSYRHSGAVNGSYSLADENEVQEFLSFLEALLGPEATKAVNRY
jgi:hypothetical protein